MLENNHCLKLVQIYQRFHLLLQCRDKNNDLIDLKYFENNQ